MEKFSKIYGKRKVSKDVEKYVKGKMETKPAGVKASKGMARVNLNQSSQNIFLTVEE